MLSRSATIDDTGAADLFPLLVGVYFAGGLLTSMVSLLVPRLKIMLSLDYAQALSIQFAFYMSYLLFALPIAIVVIRWGYLRGVAAGLGVMAVACICFAIAHANRHFPTVLLSLLLLSSGVTFLQIAGNAVTTAIAAPDDMVWRFTLLQGFNALGTVFGPLISAWFLLGRFTDALVPNLPFLVSSVALAALGLAFIGKRNALPRPPRSATPPLGRLPALLASPRMLAGTAAIFAYVGAEVTIGTLAISYLMQPTSIAAGPLAAGQLISLYWAGAMVGRFGGAVLLRSILPARLLAGVSIGALLLVGGAMGLSGLSGAIAILAIGLCNSVMFPTIYALALPDDEADLPIAAMLLCMAVVGGAIVPVVTGFAADRIGLADSLAIPGLCYLSILGFALYRRPRAGEIR